MSGARDRALVLAIQPFFRGIAFTLFEGPLSPIDWGIKDTRRGERNIRSLKAAIDLIDRLQPDVVVLGDVHRRGQRIRRLGQLIVGHAEGQSIDVCRYTRRQVRECFRDVGAKSRYEIAQAIASRVHAFAHRVPPVRKVWKSEDERMCLFDAAALVMTFYQLGAVSEEDA